MFTFETVGYIAAILTFSTFYMKTMSTLRIFGISSNIAFITYGIAIHAYPILILHIILLPLNGFRLYQVIKLCEDVKKFSTTDFSLAWIIPYAEKKTFKQGDVIFKKGDLADRLYFIFSGKLYIQELDKVISEGETIGEIGIFTDNKQRELTIQCNDEVVLYEISEDKLFQLYYQNPSVGFYLTKIIVNRMRHNKR